MAIRDKYREAYREIVAGLVGRRKELGLTQVQLAERTKIDQSQISKFERFERRLDVVNYARLCAGLELDPGILLKRLEFP